MLWPFYYVSNRTINNIGRDIYWLGERIAKENNYDSRGFKETRTKRERKQKKMKTKDCRKAIKL